MQALQPLQADQLGAGLRLLRTTDANPLSNSKIETLRTKLLLHSGHFPGCNNIRNVLRSNARIKEQLLYKLQCIIKADNLARIFILRVKVALHHKML